MELAHLPFKGGTYEDDLGVRSLQRMGRKKWAEICRVRDGAND